MPSRFHRVRTPARPQNPASARISVVTDDLPPLVPVTDRELDVLLNFLDKAIIEILHEDVRNGQTHEGE